MRKSAKKSDARLLLLVVVIALLPLAIWACSNDAGDEPDPPTGPQTTYDPVFSQPRTAAPEPAGNPSR